MELLTTTQLRLLGLSPATITRYVRIGWLRRVHRGVYSLLPPKLLDARARRLAAVLACGNRAALSHLTAAVHIGLTDRGEPRTPEVTVPSRAGRDRPGITIHRSATLRPEDAVATYRVPCTTPARTILDVCGALTPEQVEALVATAYRLDIADRRELDEQVVHNTGRPEAAALRGILAAYDALASLTESDLEKRLFVALRAAGEPLPQPQVWIDPGDGGSRIRADFLYLDELLIIETDGWRFHGHRREEDSERDQRVAAAGLRTLRITRKQIVRELERMVATVATVRRQCRNQAIAAGRIGADAPPSVWLPSGVTLRMRPDGPTAEAA